MSLLIEPFKKILHCYWLIFSTDSQHEVFVNTALVFTISNVYYLIRAISTSDIWKHFRQCSVCDCGKRFGISIQRLHTELEKNVDASRTNFVDKLLSGAIKASTTQTEASLEILAQRATARERQSLHCNKVDKFIVL